MTWARRYALRFSAFDISRTASLYGSGNYGDGTYGLEATDPLSNDEYALVAEPGEYPSASNWVYRVGDTNPDFQAQVLGLDGPMDLTPVDTAILVIERISVGTRILRALELTAGTTDGNVSGTLPASMLLGQGTYRVAVQLQFTSGRCMTVTPGDEAVLEVLGVL